MGLYYNEKNVCFCIRVSFENQNLMEEHANIIFSPLFALKKDEYYSLKFEHKSFFCSYLKAKREFLYKDIQKVETFKNGIIIYLKDGFYISISVGHSEKHNTELYDIITLLKNRCRRQFAINKQIVFPHSESNDRCKSYKEPLAKMSFSLTDAELKKLLLYDYFFGEQMIIYIIIISAFLLASIVLWNIWLLLIAGIFSILCLVLSKVSCFDALDGYMKNHQGLLQLLMYDNLLIVLLHYTDLELKYHSMKPPKSFCGLWHLKCDDFFTFVLPTRIVEENPEFFNMLCEKIHSIS